MIALALLFLALIAFIIVVFWPLLPLVQRFAATGFALADLAAIAIRLGLP